MRLAAALTGNLEKQMAEEIERGRRAIVTAARRTNEAMKADVQGQVGRVYGAKIAKTWRGRVYENRGTLAPAVYQHSKAPRLMENITGAGEIRTRAAGDAWFAIPTEAALSVLPKSLHHSNGRGGHKGKTAIDFIEMKFGGIQAVFPKGARKGIAYLVVKNARTVKRRAKSGPSTRLTSATRKSKHGDRTMLAGRQTVVMFILTKKIRRAGRLDLHAIEATYSQRYAAWIAEEWNAGR